MGDINIKEVIEDKATNFNIKRFTHGQLKSESPIKTIDLNNTTEELVDSSSKSNGNIILEKGKYIRKFDSIKKIISADKNTTINNFFGHANWLGKYTSLVNITLGFNPYSNVKKLKEIEPFFDYLYSYSKDFILIPNIRYKIGNNEIIKIDDYIKYVDETFQFLNTKNNKPIFVPVPLKFSMDGYDKLINHYMKKEHYLLWFDFEAQPINAVVNGRLRRIMNLIKESGYFKKNINFFTNIRREIISNVKDNRSAASDILASLTGANFIGINREPQRFNPNSGAIAPKPQEVWEHKARLFDNSSYYYIKQKNPDVRDKKENITQNMQRLSKEFDEQATHFLKKGTIQDYIETKSMFKEYPEVLKSINFKNKKQKGLKDFF